MRGIHMSGNVYEGRGRISPAHAGNTYLHSQAWMPAEDQPRTCGEYPRSSRTHFVVHGSAPHMRGIRWCCCWCSFFPGSAPHMRGILHEIYQLATDARISPAHAGNTSKPLTSPRSRRDQPRTCGEYSAGGGGHAASGGSAPHMRGIRRGVPGPRAGQGISPAHAGNTHDMVGVPRPRGDQPRTCGEYKMEVISRARWGGSAPHMRGIQSPFGES